MGNYIGPYRQSKTDLKKRLTNNSTGMLVKFIDDMNLFILLEINTSYAKN